MEKFLILQTLIFAQKPELGYGKERALEINQEEVEHYKATLERAKIRYQMIDTVEQEDGSIVVYVKNSTITKRTFPNTLSKSKAA